jgi:hypothetical protein
MPRPAMPKLASSLTSIPSRSSENRSNCNPTARSACDTRRRLIDGDGNASPGSIAQFGEEQTAPQVQRAQAGEHFSGTQ